MKTSNRLTTLQLPALLNQPGRHRDGDGLILLVRENGAAFWVMRYMLDGKARELGLGPLRLVNLGEAREKARKARLELIDKRDPVAIKHATAQAQRLEELHVITFREACERFLATDRVEGFRNAVHRKQWRSTLAKAYPVLGDLPLQSIDSAILLKVLLPIMKATPETGSRLRGRIERVLEWARPLGLFTGENPARHEALKDHLPAKRKVEHHRALDYREMPSFMARLREKDCVSAKALELLILSAARTGEVIGARWEEFNLTEATWIVPAGRMKAGVEHVCPLPPRAIELLRALPRKGDHVFVKGNNRPISNAAMLALMGGMGVAATPHGMRACFNTWAKNCTNYAPETRNAALAHTEEKLEQAYTRNKNRLMFDKRRRLMAEWCRYLEAPASDGENIVPIRA